MRGLNGFLIEPKGERYNNIKKIGDKELILNAEISNFEFLNREGIVKATPLAFETDIRKGDTVIVHHNVFRRWYNIKKEEKNSSSFIDEDNTSFTKIKSSHTKEMMSGKQWKVFAL